MRPSRCGRIRGPWAARAFASIGTCGLETRTSLHSTSAGAGRARATPVFARFSRKRRDERGIGAPAAKAATGGVRRCAKRRTQDGRLRQPRRTVRMPHDARRAAPGRRMPRTPEPAPKPAPRRSSTRTGEKQAEVGRAHALPASAVAPARCALLRAVPILPERRAEHEAIAPPPVPQTPDAVRIPGSARTTRMPPEPSGTVRTTQGAKTPLAACA